MTRERKEGAAPLEWAAASVGLLIFVGLFSTIFAAGFESRTDQAPELVIERQRTIATPGGSLVEFEVRNNSTQTAAAVLISGKVPGDPTESQVTIDYVPARSRVTAGLMFASDIRGKQVEIRPVSYRRP